MICSSCNNSASIGKANELAVELCANCEWLLNGMALRPDMWQRLARIVGPNHYMLHDDFYEEDGFPSAPEIKIDRSDYDKYRIKRVGPYAGIGEYLNDMFTRYLLSEKDLISPEHIDLKELQAALFNEIRTTKVDELAHRAYEILLGLPKCEETNSFLAERWEKDLNRYWGAIARCVIKNFPPSESRGLLMKALIEEEWQYPKDMLHVLSDYGEEFAIDMLEEVISKRQIPLMYDLGAIARANNPTWNKLKSLINGGRTMSLVAIDALWIEESNQYSHYFDHRRITEIAVDESDLKATLENYLLEDSTPRVRAAVERVFSKYHIEYKA